MPEIQLSLGSTFIDFEAKGIAAKARASISLCTSQGQGQEVVAEPSIESIRSGFHIKPSHHIILVVQLQLQPDLAQTGNDLTLVTNELACNLPHAAVGQRSLIMKPLTVRI